MANTVGLKNIKPTVEENYLLHHKWTFFVDPEGQGFKLYLKPSSQVICLDQRADLLREDLRRLLVKQMNCGGWLVIDMGE